MSASGPTGKNFASVDTAAGPSTVPAGGGIEEITSVDGTIGVTNPFGPVTDLRVISGAGPWITPSDYGHDSDLTAGPFVEKVIAQWAVSRASLMGALTLLGTQGFLSLVGKVLGTSQGGEQDPTAVWRLRHGGTFDTPDGDEIATIVGQLSGPLDDPTPFCVIGARADLGLWDCVFLKVTVEGIAGDGILTSVYTSGIVAGLRRAVAP